MGKKEKIIIEDIISLTPLQEGILFHYLKNPESDYYFEQLSLQISGQIDLYHFEQAWNKVIEANEMLRTVFRWEKLEKPAQVILKEHPCEIRFHDFSEMDFSQKETTLAKVKTDDRAEGFDLLWVPFRITLCKLAETQYEMIISNHHILYDGWSNGIILKDFFKVYHELCQGGQSTKLSHKTQFKEFIKWLQNQDRNKQAQFWEEYLGDFEMPAKLPIKKIIAEKKGADVYSIILAEVIRNKLEMFGKNNRITLASIFYSAWGLLLQKYCGSEDIIFGTTISGRSALIKNIDEMVGLFINTIPLRVQSSIDDKLIDIIFKVENILQVREKFENTSLTDIWSYNKLDSSESLFDTIMAIENYPLDHCLNQEEKLLSINSYSIVETTHYDLSIGIELFNEIKINFNYKSSCYDREDMANLAGHFREIIRNIIESPQAAYSQFEIISQEEKHRILYEFNNNATKYPMGKTIHQLFEEQVKKSPDHIALVGAEGGEKKKRRREEEKNVGANRHLHVCPDRNVRNVSLTYRQLNEQSNHLTGLLIEKGVLPDTIVAIMMERSIEMIIGIMGILKAGGAYLPIDPEYPSERIAYMLKDSGVKILLMDDEKKKDNCQCSIVNCQSSMKVPPVIHHTPLIIHHSSHLAYVIYTSGTTGTPKGVLVNHNSVIRLIKNTNYIEFRAEDRILQGGAISFDASTFEIWGALLNGPALVLLSKEHLLNPFFLKKAMHVFNISIAWMTSPLFNQMIDEDEEIFAPLRYLLVGGDKLSPIHINQVRQRFPLLHINNGYGPTENTTFSTTFRIDREYTENIPIGMPIANSTVYIVDKHDHLSPIGIPGELYVGGDGIARGYLNRPELTAERFKRNVISQWSFANGKFQTDNNPLNLTNDQCQMTNDYFYSTGDLARWLPDGPPAGRANKGIIEFLGRIDHQVKIRGFRIEPGEIMNRLLKHPGIKDVFVLARENEGSDKYLAAYFVSSTGLSDTELREYLLKVLPDYMIPSYFVRLEKIPLTSNGKIDYRALPTPKMKESIAYTAPRNEIEIKLAEIWAEILDNSLSGRRIGIDDNFFQLGGHSLKVTSLASRIYKEFNVKISLGEIFKSPTIRGLFDYINSGTNEQYIPINAIEKKDYYTLSSAQKRLFFLQQMDNVGTAYNISAAWIIEGIIDKPKFEQATLKLVRRHESLRTSFLMVDEEPVQRIHDKTDIEIEYKNNSSDIIHDFIRVFDLSKAPLIRLGLIKIEKDRHLFLVDMHHITTDGVSVQVLMQDFFDLQTGKELPGIILQYKDYAEWQHKEKQSKKLLAQREYWQKVYEGEIPLLALPIDKPRSPIKEYDGDTINTEISVEDMEALKRLAFASGTTLYMVFLALYNIFLAKITGQEDIIIGTPIAGRRYIDLEKIVGMFVNTLALRNNPAGEKVFMDFLRELKDITLKAFENQEYQYEELVEQISIDRNIAQNPLFDTMFALQNTRVHKFEIPGLKFVPYEFHRKTSKFDLTLTVIEEDNKFTLSFEYSINLFERETVECFLLYFKNLITTVIEKNNHKIYELDILTSDEKNRILFEFNNTEKEYPQGKVISQLFEEQVERAPDRIALMGSIRTLRTVIFSQMTYRQLDEQIDRLAGLLIEKGVLPDNIVGIMVERSIEMIVGIMGILKSGGAYLPIDPGYPEERINYMLKNSETKLLITAKNKETENINVRQREQLEHWANEKVHMLEISPALLSSSQPKILPPGFRNPANLVYVIYTSGSTGKPKGVMVQEKGFLNLLHWYIDELNIQAEDNNLLIAPISFDLAQKNLFSPLLSGGRLTLALPKIPDYLELAEIISKEYITIINCAPSIFCPLIELNDDRTFTKLISLRAVVLGGEPIRTDRLLPWVNSKNFHCEIINTYGPTECTDIAASYRIPGDFLRSLKEIPIGKPIPNVKVYILDKYLCILPVKIAGELCIGGIGLSKGYYNNENLTKNKFAHVPHLPAKKVYLTGDISRWLPDGNIEFLGRIDAQVKIRGFRIELAEIDTELAKHEAIKEAVVVARKSGTGDNYLCAYLVTHTKNQISIPILREYMQSRLPDYMVPSYFVFLERMPLTPSGKIDRLGLPEPEIKAENNYIAPRDHIEEKLVEIWRVVLDKKSSISIGIDDNFFQLGGHSLKAALMAAKIHKEFKVKLPLTYIFKRPTIRGLAEFIKGTGTSIFIPIEAALPRDYYVLSAAQKRLYILHRMDDHSTVYNMFLIILIEGTLEVSRLEFVTRKLIERHESFRTSFRMVNGEAVQEIHDHIEFAVEILGDRQEKSFIRPFDLACAPLLRVGLLRKAKADNTYLLMIDMHHIISDGMSMGIFVREFMALYAHEELPALKLQYKDYAEWQQSESVRELLKTQEKYWLEQFTGEIPVLSLPLDYKRPMVQSFAGRCLDFEIEDPTTVQLKKCARELNTTLYMILLAAFSIFMAKISNQEDIIMGTPTAGRRHADLEPIIGMFVNTLALRHHPVGEKHFVTYLDELTSRTLEAFENQDYPLEDLVEKVVQNRDMARNPLFDVMFVLQNTGISEIIIPGLKLSPYPYENNTAKFDITLIGIESNDALQFNFEYCSELFEEQTIRRFIGFFKKIISVVSSAKKPGIRLFEIEIITEEEKKQILFDFNNTKREYPADKTIQELFIGQAAQRPDFIALVAVDACETREKHEKQITYFELNEQSDRLAGLLIEKGVLPGSIVAIMLERSIELITVILGILKAGAAYMPIDQDYPQERIQYMLKDGKVQLIVNYEFLLDEPQAPLHHSSCIRHHSNLAYVIYTSGSTGKPKGVMVSHRNVVRLVTNTNFVPLNRGTCILQTGAPVFDATTFEIWGSLLNGGQLVLVDKNVILNSHRLANALQKNHITTLWLSAPLFNQLIQENIELFSPLKYMLVGGDVLSPVHINRVKKQFPRLNIINGYGPTENTTFSATYLIEKEFEQNIPIGRPIANSTAYIYDKNHQVVPIGVVGELYVGGDGVALGYLNNPELTSERFRFYRSYKSYRTYILYKTGDLTRWLPDGNIEFLGRLDHQVKIRGFRVELGEIENRLLGHPKVKDALVIIKEDEVGKDKYLCAYVVPATSIANTLDISELREYLAAVLPGYMMPSFFIMLEKIPLNPNGKVDRSALPKPIVESGQSYIPPRNEIEEKLANMWQKLLKINKIGIHDNFFTIGGHSLKVLHLVNAIQKEFHVKLDFQEIFLSPTIAGLYTLIQGKTKIYLNQIEVQSSKEYYELSYSQKRIWLLQQFESQSPVFNLPSFITLHENVDQGAVQKAIEQLIDRHDAFRTYFKVIAGQPMQVIMPTVPVNLEFIDLTPMHKDNYKEYQQHHILKEDNVPFNLENPPLFRVKLIKYKEREFDLMLTMHHIITDGWSMEILGQEFQLFYEAYKIGNIYELEPLRIQYKDYVYWHNRLTADKEKMQEAREFWEKQLPGDYPLLDLPYDFPKTKMKTKESAAFGSVIPGEIMLKLKKIAVEYKGSLFMVLLTGFNLLLYRITGQEDILLAVPGAARQHEDLKNIVGFFVNTLIFKEKINPCESLIHFLLRIQHNIYNILEYQDFPVELVCSEYKIRYPEISVFFNMSIFGNTTQENINCESSYHIPKVQDTKFDIVCYLGEYKNGITIEIHYYKELFKPVTIEKIMQLYKVILENVALNPGKKVGEYCCNLSRPKNKLIIPTRVL